MAAKTQYKTRIRNHFIASGHETVTVKDTDAKGIYEVHSESADGTVFVYLAEMAGSKAVMLIKDRAYKVVEEPVLIGDEGASIIEILQVPADES